MPASFMILTPTTLSKLHSLGKLSKPVIIGHCLLTYCVSLFYLGERSFLVILSPSPHFILHYIPPSSIRLVTNSWFIAELNLIYFSLRGPHPTMLRSYSGLCNQNRSLLAYMGPNVVSIWVNRKQGKSQYISAAWDLNFFLYWLLFEFCLH